MSTFCIVTLGCRANQTDSEHIADLLIKRGYTQVNPDENADFGIMNSCTVTAEADRKSGQMLRRLQKKCSVVAATGCGAAAKGGLHSHIPEGVVVIAPKDREKIAEILDGLKNTFVVKTSAASVNLKNQKASDKAEGSFGRHRTRALLKVQEGCSHMCTFCIVPMVRGPLKSFETEDLLPQINELTAKGYREIVLTGTHLALWGQDSTRKLQYRREGREGRCLADLLEDLIAETEGVRFRISSIEPMSFPRRIFDLMAKYPDRLCPHLHLVVQHASDTILKAMHRDYTLAEYESLAEEFFKKVPGGCLTTDILLGFPGETEEDIKILEAFLNRVKFYHLHVFPYSKRAGTPAAVMPNQVDEKVKKERVHRIIELGEKISKEVYNSFVGTKRKVLAERLSQKPGYVLGTADNFLSAEIPGDESLIGKIIEADIF